MAFLTQNGNDTQYISYHVDDNGELEALIADVSQSSQSTLLLKKRKELHEVDDALDFMKEEFAARMRVCDDRHEDFLLKQQDMKEQVTRFEKFIQENDAKKIRADSKAKNEAKTREQLTSKIETLKLSLESMRKENGKLSEKVARLRTYPQFLEQAVEMSDGEYEEINDMLNRHKTLVDAQIDLRQQVESAEHESDATRSTLQHLEHETQNALLVQNIEIHRAQQRIENFKRIAFKIESQLEQQDRYSKDQQRELGQVLMSVRNLFHRCTISSRRTLVIPHIDERKMSKASFLAECLKTIMFQMGDLDSICKTFKLNRQHHHHHTSHPASGAAAAETGGNNNTVKAHENAVNMHQEKNQSGGDNSNLQTRQPKTATTITTTTSTTQTAPTTTSKKKNKKTSAQQEEDEVEKQQQQRVEKPKEKQQTTKSSSIFVRKRATKK